MQDARFLVIEDESATRAELVRLFARCAVEATASGVEQAFEWIAKDAWMGVLVGVEGPNASGLDVLAHARARHPLLPALVATRRLDAAVLHAAFDLHAQCILKPVTEERIARFCASASSPEPRIRMAAKVWAGRYQLSEAEADVLCRAALGADRDEIAFARGSSVLTVQRHACNLLRRTRDESLQTAVARLLRELV